MKDPYEQAFKDIANALWEQWNMIDRLARRILPVKEYLDFKSELSELSEKSKQSNSKPKAQRGGEVNGQGEGFERA